MQTKDGLVTKDDLVYSILSTCEALHGAVTGSSDVHTHEDLKQLAEWLRMRLANWKPTPIPKFAAYDSMVFVLASIALGQWDEAFPR